MHPCDTHGPDSAEPPTTRALVRLRQRVKAAVLGALLLLSAGTAVTAAEHADGYGTAPADSVGNLTGEPETASETFETGLQSLLDAGYSKKKKIVQGMIETGHPRLLTILQAFLEGRLHYVEGTSRILIMPPGDDDQVAEAPLSGDSIRIDGIGDTKKIRTNNSLRSFIRGQLARLNLGNPDASTRLKAVLEISERLKPEDTVLFEQALEEESAESVREAIKSVLALFRLKQDDETGKLAAIERLEGSLYPRVKVTLESVVEEYADRKDELGTDIYTAANDALQSIESRLKFYGFIENVFFGLSLGSVLLLAAIGLAITFGVMGVINMAHGELIMLGAYTTYIVQNVFPGLVEYSLFMSIPAAFLVSGLFGIAIERGVIRHLYGRPLETLLATFGISLILQQLVRTGVSAQNVIVTSPAWMSGSLQINPVLSVTYNRLYIILFSLIVFAVFLYVLKSTVLGLQVRAVSQNRAMAKAIGVRSDWVDALTFGLGSGIAGIAGVALSQLTNVGPNLGQSYIIDSFMVVVFGGVGNLWGTLVGAMSLGVVNKFLEPWAGAVLAKLLVLVFIILFIQKHPRGLFPKKGRAADD